MVPVEPFCRKLQKWKPGEELPGVRGKGGGGRNVSVTIKCNTRDPCGDGNAYLDLISLTYPGYDSYSSARCYHWGNWSWSIGGISLLFHTTAYKFLKLPPQECSKNVQWKIRLIWGDINAGNNQIKKGSWSWEVKRRRSSGEQEQRRETRQEAEGRERCVCLWGGAHGGHSSASGPLAWTHRTPLYTQKGILLLSPCP